MTLLLTCLLLAGFLFLITFLYALLKIAKISEERAGYEEGHIVLEEEHEEIG